MSLTLTMLNIRFWHFQIENFQGMISKKEICVKNVDLGVTNRS